MKNFIITESFTGYCEYTVDAETKEEAMKLYKDGEYYDCQDTDIAERYDYKFYSIEEDN